jgi:hypothetical protein
MSSKVYFASLVLKARRAGMVAGQSVIPEPMVVQQIGAGGEVLKTYEPVMDGVCGFAWVQIKGNTTFGRWAKQNGASKAYPNGLMFWVGEFDQSMTRKEAYASAFAKVLNEAGIQAYADSRMD